MKECGLPRGAYSPDGPWVVQGGSSGLEPLDPQENSVPSQGWEEKPGSWRPRWQEPGGGHVS